MIIIKWTYKAKDSKNKITKGFIYAQNRQEANKKLRDKGYFPLKLSKEFELGTFKFTSKGMTDDDMSELFSNIAILMEAGLSVTESWEIIMNEAEKKEVKDFMKAIYIDITSGKNLYSALKREANIPKLVLAILKAGEGTGELVKAFEQASKHYSDKNETMVKLKGALFYPVLTITAALITIYAMSVKVIPTIIGSMGDNVTKNVITNILIALSEFFQKYKLLPIIGLIIFILIMRKLVKTKLKKQFDYFLFNLPYVGNLIKKSLVLVFVKTYVILYEADVKVTEILKILREASDNHIYQDNVDKIITGVNNGEPISKNLSKEIFDITVINIFKVSEETGEVKKSFNVIIKRVQQEVDLALEKLLKVIGPLSTVVLASIVLLMVVGVLGPIFSVYENMG